MDKTLIECTTRLRQKVFFFLINGETNLIEPTLYPFSKSKLPVICNSKEEKKMIPALESGNRSIIFLYKDLWFKAKGIGISSGKTRSHFYDGKIFSYYLTDEPQMGDGSVIWGYQKLNEAKKEIKGMKFINEKNLSEIKPVGLGIYSNGYLLHVKNRIELFDFLSNIEQEKLLNHHNNYSSKNTLCCTFSTEFSDLRVDEILYGFLFPKIDKILDSNDSKDYVRWLGSSCAYNLKCFHDQGLLHGTLLLGENVNTNSYAGNHLVGLTKTSICDFDLVKEITSESEIKAEVHCLIHLMNPLKPFKYLTGFRTEMRTVDRMSAMSTMNVLYDPISMIGPPANAKKLRDILATEFTEGVKQGYQGNIYEIQDKLKRNMLNKITQIKEKMWQLYGIPKGMQRGIKYVQRTLKIKKIPKKDLKDVINSLQDS